MGGGGFLGTWVVLIWVGWMGGGFHGTCLVLVEGGWVGGGVPGRNMRKAR